MQTSNSTTYNIYVTQQGGNDFFGIEFENVPGMDDTTVLSLIQTLRDFTWPSAIQPVAVNANKSALTGDYYTCDTATTPPTFN